MKFILKPSISTLESHPIPHTPFRINGTTSAKNLTERPVSIPMTTNTETYTGRMEGSHSFTSADKKNLSNWNELLPESTIVKKAKDVLNLFVKSFTAMRIYPPENPTVENCISSFNEKIQEFLREYKELKLIVNEFSFIFKEKTIFQDTHKKASLPFLFFKDGMRELAFSKGLKNEELQDFLLIIKDNAGLPLEDSDIVNSMWTKDFPHIRYFAIDEFIDSESGEISDDARFNIDKKKLTKGKIKLTVTDLTEIQKRCVALGAQPNDKKEEEEDNEITLEDIPLPFQMPTTSKGDSPEIKSMLEELRSQPPLTETIILLFEILYLENRTEAISSVLNILKQLYKDAVYKSLFTLASLILHRLQELKELGSGQQEEKEQMLEKTLQHFKGESSLTYLKKLFINGQIEDFDSFFQYMKTIGPKAIPLASDIWEETKDSDIKSKASNFLYEVGKEDIASLFSTAQDHRVSLTKEIIKISAKIDGKQILPHLIKFTDYRDKGVKLAVINALAEIDDESVNPILIRFLSDRDEELRTKAALSLKPCEDQDMITFIIQIVEQKDFRERLKQEKKALLEYLAEIRSEKVSALLRSILKKWSILKKSKQNETRLCAIPALEKMRNQEAQKILEEGARLRNKTIRMACKLALRKNAENFEPARLLAGEQSA